jgi:hypothetical protein
MFHQLNSTVLVCAGTGLVGVILPIAAAFLMDSAAVLRRTGRTRHLLVTLTVAVSVAVAGCSLLASGLSVPSPTASDASAVSARFLLLFAPAMTVASLVYRYLRIRNRTTQFPSPDAVRGVAQ